MQLERMNTKAIPFNQITVYLHYGRQWAISVFTYLHNLSRYIMDTLVEQRAIYFIKVFMTVYMSALTH